MNLNEAMLSSFGRAFATNAVVEQRLKQQVTALQPPVQQALELARKEILGTETLRFSSSDYFATFTRAIDSLFAMDELAIEELTTLLNARISNIRNKQLLTVGWLILLVVAATIVARRVTHSITDRLHQAVALAEGIATGDLTGQVEASGQDEIARLMLALTRIQASLMKTVAEVRHNAQGVVAISEQAEQLLGVVEVFKVSRHADASAAISQVARIAPVGTSQQRAAA